MEEEDRERESERRSVTGSRNREMLLLLLKVEGASTSQGMLVTTRSWEEAREDLPLEPAEGPRPC